MKSLKGFDRLKFMGYCTSQLPPESIDCTYEDFLNYAKFHLSRIYRIPQKDAIWSRYTDEEILVEYFAHLFVQSKAERENFLTKLFGVSEDLYKWFDDKIEENQKELSQLKDSVSFSQETLGE